MNSSTLINQLKDTISELESKINSLKSVVENFENNSHPHNNYQIRSEDFMTIVTDIFWWSINYSDDSVEIIWEHPIYNLQGCFILNSFQTNLKELIHNLQQTKDNSGEISFNINTTPLDSKSYFSPVLNKYSHYNLYQIKDIQSLQFSNPIDIFEIVLSPSHILPDLTKPHFIQKSIPFKLPKTLNQHFDFKNGILLTNDLQSFSKIIKCRKEFLSISIKVRHLENNIFTLISPIKVLDIFYNSYLHLH